jgi:hypothetical protein
MKQVIDIEHLTETDPYIQYRMSVMIVCSYLQLLVIIGCVVQIVFLLRVCVEIEEKGLYSICTVRTNI